MSRMKDYLLDILEEVEGMSKTQREAHLAQKFSDMEPSARATQIKVIGTYVDDMTSNDWRPKRSPISPKLNASLVQAVEDSLRDAGLRATYVFSRPSSKGGLRPSRRGRSTSSSTGPSGGDSARRRMPPAWRATRCEWFRSRGIARFRIARIPRRRCDRTR